jgi:uncharacterized protein YcfJ
MLNKKLNQALLISAVFVGASMSAVAGHEPYGDRARVISATPQIEHINTPVQECRTEYVRESVYENRSNSNGGAIVGTIAGGVIGSRFGGGNGRLIATAVGAGLGAVIGDRHDNRYNQPTERVVTRPVDRCVTVGRWETINRGYLVEYEYNGRRYTTETAEHPGRYIPVDVIVRPSGYISSVEYRYDKHNQKHNRGHDKKDYRHHY